jgi:hypothetical protein
VTVAQEALVTTSLLETLVTRTLSVVFGTPGGRSDERCQQVLIAPLRLEPIYDYRPWGGRELAGLLTKPLPGDGPGGEAWVLSDRQDHQSRVAVRGPGEPNW